MNNYTITILLLCCIVIMPSKTHAYSEIPDDTVRQRIKAVLGEAEDQGFLGMFAVACAINNRPEGLIGVYGQFNNRHLEASDEKRVEASLAVSLANSQPELCYSLIAGADAWENISDFGYPDGWGASYYVLTIRDHVFFRRLESGK